MLADLIHVRTCDGVRLDGSLFIPECCQQKSSDDEPAVWLLIHGTGSNFYAGGVLQAFCEELVQAKFAVARVNTRGHDVISGQFGGAAFETISDCVHDIRAWIEQLTVRGFRRIFLAGHSMGAVKVLFSQAHDPQPLIAGVMGISPPRFCHAEWLDSKLAAPFREHFRLATELVAAGRGDELIRVQQPLPLWLTASGFLAKYGPHDDYDFIRLLPRLNCPTLIVVGSESVASSPAFSSVPAAVIEQQQSQANLQLRLVAGADTGYSKHQDEPARIALEWAVSK